MVKTKLLTGREVMEALQYEAAPFSYQSDRDFRRISTGNFGSYVILGKDNDFTYAVPTSASPTFGYVFENQDIQAKPTLGMIPVLTVTLVESSIKMYQRVFRVHVRRGYARQHVATKWYLAYAEYFGGIVCDFEHVQGGKRLWKSFVQTATRRNMNLSTVDAVSGIWNKVVPAALDEQVWPDDASKRQQVLVLESPAH